MSASHFCGCMLRTRACALFLSLFARGMLFFSPFGGLVVVVLVSWCVRTNEHEHCPEDQNRRSGSEDTTMFIMYVKLASPEMELAMELEVWIWM